MYLLNEYKEIRQKVFKYFGYVEDWRILPLEDTRGYFWSLEGTGPGKVCFAKTEKDLLNKNNSYCENKIYMQRHLSKWVYHGASYTMIVVDTHVDSNQLLQIFTNSMRRYQE